MIISYFRSSSYNAWSYCQQKYFLSYVLGYQEQSNLKADMGTITHKTLEVLAALKKYSQDNKRAKKLRIEDDAIGEVVCLKSKLMTPYTLTNDEVDKVNKSRINKTIYKWPCRIEYGHTIYGKELVQDIFKRSYKYYSDKYDHHNWTSLHYRDVHNWCWMALDHMDGLYDPRKRTIVEPERRFDIVIDKPWAKYQYGNFEGQLALKGTIDLITQVGDNVYEIVDWKTGQRLDWATGETKTQEKLNADPQLMLYYYAAKSLYPDKDIILTIFFIRDGGPFSVCFDEEHILEMESLIQERYNSIKSCELPELLDPKHRDFRCQKLCSFYKNKWPGTNMTMCDYIHREVKTKGIEEVTRLHKAKGHSFDTYNAPGE